MQLTRFIALVVAVLLGWFFGQAVGTHFFPSYARDNAIAVWIAGGCIVGLPVYAFGLATAALIDLDLTGHTSVFVRRPVGWLFRSLMFVAETSLFLAFLFVVARFLSIVDLFHNHA